LFTGLIEEVGEVNSILKSTKSAQISIYANDILNDVKIGDSIAVNGVCVTVTDFYSNKFSADIMPETLRRSNLGSLKRGSKVNLERAVCAGERFGGHIVSGHIDETGKVKSIEKEDTAAWITIEASSNILKYVVLKGSITLDGVSLTVADAGSDYFKVSIIPHTKEETTLLSKNVGNEINIECDIIAKYLEKLFKFDDKDNDKSKANESGISESMLRKAGFI
jgi:riboflavin synthase